MWKLAALALIGVSGCVSNTSPPIVPIEPRGYGAGHGVEYESYEAARLARDRGYDGAPAAQPGRDRVISSEELTAAGLPVAGGGLPAAEPVRSAPLDAMAPIDGALPANPAPAVPSNTIGISDEQSFEAVSARETIESDAERLARQADAYRVIQPVPVPTRSDPDRPNIVAYALSTDNVVGQQVYSRSRLNIFGRPGRACAKYTSPDLAQEAFLERGGPRKDRLGLDPDGDGFACGWDPAPFRAARG